MDTQSCPMYPDVLVECASPKKLVKTSVTVIPATAPAAVWKRANEGFIAKPVRVDNGFHCDLYRSRESARRILSNTSNSMFKMQLLQKANIETKVSSCKKQIHLDLYQQHKHDTRLYYIDNGQTI